MVGVGSWIIPSKTSIKTIPLSTTIYKLPLEAPHALQWEEKIPNKVSLYKNTNRVVIFRGTMSELIILQIIRDFEKYRKGKVSLTLGGCSDNVYKIKTNTFKARLLNQKILHPIFNIPIRYVSKIKTGLLERKMSMLKISIHNFAQSWPFCASAFDCGQKPPTFWHLEFKIVVKTSTFNIFDKMSSRTILCCWLSRRASCTCSTWTATPTRRTTWPWRRRRSSTRWRSWQGNGRKTLKLLFNPTGSQIFSEKKLVANFLFTRFSLGYPRYHGGLLEAGWCKPGWWDILWKPENFVPFLARIWPREMFFYRFFLQLF